MDNKINKNETIINTLINELKLMRRDNTTDLKLRILPQLMRIDRVANMIGEYSGNNIFLQTEKIAGNINACMGFVKDCKLNIFIPNTALNLDMRTITHNRNKIIAILKKILLKIHIKILHI